MSNRIPLNPRAKASRTGIASAALLCIIGTASQSLASETLASEISVYHIGNSLTQDARAGGGGLEELTGFTHEYHVQCGSSLTLTLDNPNPCVNRPGEDIRWDLADLESYDALVLQPHTNNTWQEELDAAVSFASLAPDVELFVYATWGTTTAGDWNRSFDGANERLGQHLAGYEWFIEQLGDRGFDATLINAGQAFEDAGGGPDLYRDTIHASFGVGRTLAATTVANALTLALIPEPTTGMLLLAGTTLIARRKRRAV